MNRPRSRRAKGFELTEVPTRWRKENLLRHVGTPVCSMRGSWRTSMCIPPPAEALSWCGEQIPNRFRATEVTTGRIKAETRFNRGLPGNCREINEVEIIDFSGKITLGAGDPPVADIRGGRIPGTITVLRTRIWICIRRAFGIFLVARRLDIWTIQRTRTEYIADFKCDAEDADG